MKTTTAIVDCQGRSLDQARWWIERFYGRKASDWPKAIIVDNREVMHEFHKLHADERCWHCGRSRWDCPPQSHHIVGNRGRSDELCNLALLGLDCHALAHGGALTFYKVVLLKAENDPMHTDFVRLQLLRRRFIVED